MEEAANEGDYNEFSSIAAEIGAIRRNERSLRRRSVNFRRKNITDLPSRNVVFMQASEDSSDTEDGRLNDIVQHLHGDHMDDASKSVKDCMVTLREMPRSLTLKRRVRDRLLESVEKRRSRGRPPSCFSRLGYLINYSFLRMIEYLKETNTRLEPWYSLLKTVEGHFGSGVATYFKFLRSLLLMNSVVFFISLIFITVPQLILVSRRNSSVVYNNFRFGNLFTGEGYLGESVLFYGYYSNATIDVTGGYNIPNAYFFSSLVCYVIVFVLLSISMAVSYRKNFIEGAHGVRNVFANKIFCGWDFGIATSAAAALKSRSIHTELKELLEEQRIAETPRNWFNRLYALTMQMCVNLAIIGCLAVGAYFSWKYLRENARNNDTQTAMMVSLVLTIIVHIGPVLFSFILRLEEYESPRTATYVTLVRTFILDAVVLVVAVAHRLGVAEDADLCWETALGQEVYRLVLLDTLIGLVGTSIAQFIRFRISQSLWEGIGCPEVDVARNTINLLYNQTLLYVGLYFSPLLSLVIVLKLLLTLYVKYWCVVRHCRPSARMWRAAQTQTIFLTSAFVAFVCVLILYGYILSSVRTSECGPFRGKKLMYDAVLTTLAISDESSTVLAILLYIRKPGVVAVLLVTMGLGAYYLRAVGIARARVLRIMKDILQVHAEDKKFLLDKLSLFSKMRHQSEETESGGQDEVWTKHELQRELSGPSRSLQDLRHSQHLSPPKASYQSQSLTEIYDMRSECEAFLNAERESSDSSLEPFAGSRLRFNPVFTESPAPRFQEERLSTRVRNNDDRTPSRITLLGPNKV